MFCVHIRLPCVAFKMPWNKATCYSRLWSVQCYSGSHIAKNWSIQSKHTLKCIHVPVLVHKVGLLARNMRVREDINTKKTFSFGHCPKKGKGDLPMPEIFGPFSRSAFLVIKKSQFLQKCQCIELLTVFDVDISPSPPHIFANLFFKSLILTSEKKTKLPKLGSWGF